MAVSTLPAPQPFTPPSLISRLESYHQQLGFLLLFLALLSWFYWGHPWYPAATLEVSGNVPRSPARLAIRWASTYGFNGYEQFVYDLKPFPPLAGKDGFPLSVTRTGERNPVSSGSEVLLNKIVIDGTLHEPSSQERGKVTVQDHGYLRLVEQPQPLVIQVNPSHHLRLEFLAYYIAGVVAVDAGGWLSRHDLYSDWGLNEWTRDSVRLVDYWLVQPDGGFVVSLDMPRYPVHTFQIESKEPFSLSSWLIRTEDGVTIDLGVAVSNKGGAALSMAAVEPLLQRYYHPHRLVLQVLYALLTTWILSRVLAFIRGFQGARDIFLKEQRYLFWSMFLSGCLLFFLWHLTFWPGVTSTDSLKIWRAAHIPGMYLGDHPTLNVLFYQYLSFFWDNVAVVPVFQNLCTSLLLSWLLFTLYRQGLPLCCMIPFFLLALFSVPLGLYTIALWKDVPFALLTVWIAFRLAGFVRQHRAGTLRLSRLNWLTLYLAAVAVMGLRHNGIVVLLSLPFFVLGFQVARFRWWYLAAALGCCLFVWSLYSVPQIFRSPAVSYFSMQSRTYARLTAEKLSTGYLKERVGKFFHVLDITSKEYPSDLIQNSLYGRYNYNFLKSVRWNDVYPYLPLPRSDWQRGLARKGIHLMNSSLHKPWLFYSWNPFYMLYLLVAAPLFFRWLPMSAVFSSFILLQAAALVLLDIINWRYYFFVYLAVLFLIPMMITECIRYKRSSVSLL